MPSPMPCLRALAAGGCAALVALAAYTPPVAWSDDTVPRAGVDAQMDHVLGAADSALADPSLGAEARVIVKLFKAVNEARAEHDLHPLRLDARLVAAAQEHAASMSHGRFCRHSGLDGRGARARIRAHDYGHNNWSGENILCSRWTPGAALSWWLSSTPHRKNVLHRHYTHIGVGYDPAGRYGPSWVLTFADGEDETVGVSYLPAEGAVLR